MSNPLVGSVYKTIIEEVINSSRVDFEESGVEESALELLRLGWQHKLTQLDVAQFPWDPKPDPPPPAQEPPPPTAPAPNHSQARFTPQAALPGGPPPPAVAGNGIKMEHGDGTGIKQEPGTQAPMMPPYQNFNSMENKSVAASRAAQQLQAQYGPRAAGSINALSQQAQAHAAGAPQAQPQGDASQAQQAYRQQMANATSQQQSHQQRDGQTDGAGDDDDTFEGVLLQKGPNGDVNELGRLEIDRMLHDQIAAKARSMEGGGLMLPLAEAARQPRHRGQANKGKDAGSSQFDGGDDLDDDAEEEDEDAINSDLDDSDEDQNDDVDDDDGGLGHIMLCMYDKVQRVKNKWKCTLKDGVLTVNGKEYVFHKATGEYEW